MHRIHATYSAHTMTQRSITCVHRITDQNWKRSTSTSNYFCASCSCWYFWSPNSCCEKHRLFMVLGLSGTGLVTNYSLRRHRWSRILYNPLIYDRIGVLHVSFTMGTTAHFDTVPAVIFLSVVFLFGLIVRRLFFHPLHRFPGPKWAAVTWSYKAYYALTGGKMLQNVERLHEKYGRHSSHACGHFLWPFFPSQGPVVRVAPDEVSSISIYVLFADIYPPPVKFQRPPCIFRHIFYRIQVCQGCILLQDVRAVRVLIRVHWFSELENPERNLKPSLFTPCNHQLRGCNSTEGTWSSYSKYSLHTSMLC